MLNKNFNTICDGKKINISYLLVKVYIRKTEDAFILMKIELNYKIRAKVKLNLFLFKF